MSLARGRRATSGRGRLGWAILLLLGVATAAAESRPQVSQVLPASDFVYRDAGPYENLGFTDYVQPEFAQYARVSYYGPLGDYLIKGYDVYSWTETRTTGLTEGFRSTRFVPRWGRFERNVVAQESQAGWSGSLIIGDEIRTLFTPLTLRLVGFDGARLDAQTRRLRFSSIAQRWTGPVPGTQYGQASRWSEFNSTGLMRDAALLVGGHGEVELGALRVGATGVDFHLFDADQAGFNLRGQLRSTQVLPSFLVVRLLDDSPEDDRGGAVATDLELYLNGERSALVPFIVSVNDENPTAVGRANVLTGQFRRSVYDHEGTYFGDVFYLRQHLSGADVSGSVNLPELVDWVRPIPAGPWEARGHRVILAYYDLRTERHVRSARVRALVGNDYRVEVVGIYDSEPQVKQEDLRWLVGGFSGRTRAPGNVQDLSNLDWVELDVGQQTGRMLLGVNGSWEGQGARIRWECARSREYRQYPDGTPGYRPDKEIVAIRRWDGKRSSVGAGAYYLTALWRRGQWEAGGEAFSIEEDFNGGFVEDNDDNDRYPDMGAGHRPVPFWTAPVFDPDGVFPGKDADHDGVPDTNRNGNELPDYAEPFLRFDVEPDDYVYGRDWNGNGMPDEREDDLRPDFPYEVDQRGTHAYGQVHLPYGVSLGAGRLHARGIGSGGRNDNTYGQAALEQADAGWGRVRLEARWQRIHDDIESPYRRFEEVLTGTNNFPSYQPNTVKDLLFWRNSVDRQCYLEGEWRVVPGGRVWGNLRHELNRQLGGRLSDGSEQAPDRVRLWTGVVRGEYVWEPGPQWRVTTQVKALLLKQARSSLPVALVDQWTVMPVLKVQFRLTPRTEIWGGLEGLPGLPLRLEDRAEGWNSVEEETRVAQVTNRSAYYGYQIAMNLGVRQRQRRYDDPTRAAENLSVTVLFLRVIMGFDE